MQAAVALFVPRCVPAAPGFPPTCPGLLSAKVYLGSAVSKHLPGVRERQGRQSWFASSPLLGGGHIYALPMAPPLVTLSLCYTPPFPSSPVSLQRWGGRSSRFSTNGRWRSSITSSRTVSRRCRHHHCHTVSHSPDSVTTLGSVTLRHTARCHALPPTAACCRALCTNLPPHMRAHRCWQGHANRSSPMSPICQSRCLTLYPPPPPLGDPCPQPRRS